MSPLDFYKCLSDETRLRCLLLIAKETELCVCELMRALNESQPKISRHLAHLRKHGLLKDRRQGQWVFYRLAENLPDWSNRVLNDTVNQNSDFLELNIQRLIDMGDRPARSRACCA